MDDYEIDDLACPACGHHATHSRHCSNFHCEDGQEDAYDDDPINESPGTYYPCDECGGTGIERWCPKCGADYWRAKAEAKKPAPPAVAVASPVPRPDDCPSDEDDSHL